MPSPVDASGAILIDCEYQMRRRSDSKGRLWVAFGISVVWETKVTYFTDDVRIEIVPS